MLNLTIASIVFVAAVWFLNRLLDEQGIPNGIARGILVLVLASLTAWGVWWAVGWAQKAKTEQPQVIVQDPGGVSQILKAASQGKP